MHVFSVFLLVSVTFSVDFPVTQTNYQGSTVIQNRLQENLVGMWVFFRSETFG